MAFIGRRRTDQSSDLKDGAPSPEALGHMVSQHIPDLVIVRADKGRVFRRIRLSVKEDYRDTGVVDLVDFLGKRVGLVGRDDQQVDAGGGQTVNLTLLQFTVIVGRNEAKGNPVVEVGRHFQLFFQFLPPGIFGALRYTHNEIFIPFVAGKKKRGSCCQEQRTENGIRSHRPCFQ